ncbi:MAG: MATE family efflux transporter [Lachnospiraceae bacterium]|nr:MATE family efflux transporter [Lachnospiraceae bacterium]
MKNLTEGKPIKLILLFAIPLFIGQLFNLFYSLVDTRIVGSTLGEDALAAVGATTTVSDLLVGLLNGFSNGCAIVISTYFGAKDEKHMKKALGGTIVLGIGLSVSISVLCLLFLNGLLRFLNIDSDILSQSRAYLGIILAGLLASTLYNMCAAVLRAIGDSFTPLLFLILASFLNIFLDYSFILHLHMDVGGAAFATVISQALSAFLCFFYIRKKYPSLILSSEDWRIGKEVYRKLFSTGMSMGFMVSFVNLGTVALQTSINTFGTNIIVAHTGARKITSIFMLPFSVLGTTLATYCGQNLGAGKFDRLRIGIRDTLLVTFAWCLGVMIAANTVSPLLVRAITASEEQEVISTATLYLRINTAFYFVPAIICLFRNSMQGFGDSKTPIFSSSLELIGKVAIAFLLAPAVGYVGIIAAEPIVWFIMVIPLIVNMLRNPLLRRV